MSSELYKSKLRSADTKYTPPLDYNHGINRDGHTFMNWVGEYTYGSYVDGPDDDSAAHYGSISFRLEKCMYINHYFFVEEGVTICIDDTIKDAYNEYRKEFDNLPNEDYFRPVEWFDCIYEFDLNKWPSLDKEFQPISMDRCQKEFFQEFHHKTGHAKCALKECFQEKYRYIFRRKIETFHTKSDLYEVPKKILQPYLATADEEGYMPCQSHEFIFAHDRDAMGKIQAEIDEVQRVWQTL